MTCCATTLDSLETKWFDESSRLLARSIWWVFSLAITLLTTYAVIVTIRPRRFAVAVRISAIEAIIAYEHTCMVVAADVVLVLLCDRKASLYIDYRFPVCSAGVELVAIITDAGEDGGNMSEVSAIGVFFDDGGSDGCRCCVYCWNVGVCAKSRDHAIYEKYLCCITSRRQFVALRLC